MTEIVIKPQANFLSFDFSELWRYRELLYIFSWRDVKVRYKQTILGIVWVIFQPLVTTGIFSIFFGKIAKIPSNGLPYPLFVLSGLVIWNFFANGLTNASQSLVNNQSILQKIYFPRVIIPISAIITAGIDFILTLVILLFACMFYHYVPSLSAIYLFPIIILITLLTLLGLGFFTAAVNVKYRDVRFALPFFVQVGLFITPVIYPLSVIYDYRKWFLMLNPLTGVIETFRTVIAGSGQIDFGLLTISLIVSLGLFIFGFAYFRKTEIYFADIA